MTAISPWRALTYLLCILIVVRWIYFIDFYSVNLPYLDHWDVFNAFFEKHTALQKIHWQHGPHRHGIPLVLTGLLLEWSHWNIRILCFTIGISLISTCFIYIWYLIKSNQLNLYTTLFTFAVFLIPTQYGLFANTPNLSHGAFPAILLGSTCLIYHMKSPVLKYILLSVISINALYT
jgi:hypothetical protein